MINTIRHKGLKQVYKHNKTSKVPPEQVNRIYNALSDLDSAQNISDMDLPKYRLHPLKGNMQGLWGIRISANWRIVFRFKDGDAYDVDLMDYH